MRRPLILFLLFVVLAVIVRLGLLSSVDRELFGGGTLTRPLELALRQFGLLLSLAWLSAGLYLRERRLRPLALAWALFAGASVLELALKLLLTQPAGALVDQVGALALVNSFPSGHALRAAFVLNLLAGRSVRWQLVAAVLALGVGVGLVAGGYHFASDVLGGLLLGWSAAFAWWHLAAAQSSGSTSSS